MSLQIFHGHVGETTAQLGQDVSILAFPEQGFSITTSRNRGAFMQVSRSDRLIWSILLVASCIGTGSSVRTRSVTSQVESVIHRRI